MKKYKTIVIKKTEVDSVICNCCGREINKDQYGLMEDYITIKKTWGYNSAFDGQSHELDVCNDCYEKWIKSFKHKFSLKDD
ncbi:hypothetical protein [Vallitalea okinawensis]|uniref:hypothetical protein n=1 Tax=Vallitalea okinawensis TaxID=2078660 RepID=UPI000CFDB757|nr:hypothetical protein [Vallitalea okinawensis]